MILVDTSVWIDFFSGSNSKEKTILHKLIEQEKPIFLTSIVLMEILQGIKNSKDFFKVKDYILSFPFVEAKPPETFIRAAEIYRKCREEGITIRSSIDCIISEIAIENGLTLLHKDRDYDVISRIVKELKIFKV